MANGHVEIHDPFSNNDRLKTSSDSDSKSSTDQDRMDDTMEFRLLMAYAKRRRPASGTASPTGNSPDPERRVSSSGGASSPDTTANGTKWPATKKKKKKKKKRSSGLKLPGLLSCFKPQMKDDEQLQPESVQHDDSDRCGTIVEDGVEEKEEEKEEDKLDEAASILTQLADEIPFAPPDLEQDCEQDEVERVIALLLRETGDRLNEEMLRKLNVSTELFGNYSFFSRLLRTFLIRVGLVNPEPDALGPQASPKTQIAVACEVTTRLSDIHTLPMRRMYGNGARFLQENYTSWIQRHGGYEEAFHSDNEDEEDQ